MKYLLIIEHYSYKIHTLLMTNSAYPPFIDTLPSWSTPFYDFSKISTPYKHGGFTLCPFCMNWEIKMQLDVWAHHEPISGFSGGPEGTVLEKFIIVSLKLIWCNLLKITKLKLSVSNKNCYYNLKYAQLCLFFVLFRSRLKQR